MAGVQSESDDDIEVLDVTTPVPRLRSRLAPTRATATAVSSSPPGSPSLGYSSSLTDEQGASDGQSVGEVDSDGLFDVDEWKPLRERLKSAAAAATAASRGGSSATMAASGKSRSIPPPAVPGSAAAAATATGSPSDEEKKRRRNAATRAVGGGVGGAGAVGRLQSGKGKSKLREAAGGSSDMCWQEEEEREEEEEEEEEVEEECVMNTQESEVVDLLSDSDDAGKQ